MNKKTCDCCKEKEARYKCQYKDESQTKKGEYCAKCISKLIEKYKIDYILSV